MREYFKAWRDQDPSHRDYRPYFRATLCYLEGAWTASAQNIDEPFASDRHFVDAKSWMELHEKSRYIAYSGTKSRQENLSFLPTKIMGLINDTIPNFAQWNYRIMCHPLKRNLPTKRLRVVEDLAARMRNQKNILRHERSRSARYQVNTRDQDHFREGVEGWKTLLDQLMEEIPGKDNYQGKKFSLEIKRHQSLEKNETAPYFSAKQYGKLLTPVYYRSLRPRRNFSRIKYS